jgi:hypothetical protein
MDFGNVIHDAFFYTKEGVFQHATRWLKLILAIICLGLPLNGYIMRIYRGAAPAPEVDRWGSLFVDGLKLIVVGIIYSIPVILLWGLIYGSMLLAVVSGAGNMDYSMMNGWAPNLVLLVLLYVFEIIIGIIFPVAAIRFARTNSFSEAFNFHEIFATIGKIGWINYIIALILIALIIAVPVGIIVFVFLIAGFLTKFIVGAFIAMIVVILFLAPLFSVLQARYMTSVYDSADTPE